MLLVTNSLHLQPRLGRVNLSLVFKFGTLSVTIILQPRRLDLATGILGDIVAENLSFLLQRFEMLWCYDVTLSHNNLACWLKNDIFISCLSHRGAQLSQGVALSLPGSFQLLFAARLSLHAVFVNAISRLENIAVASILQLVDQLYYLLVQVLIQFEKLLVQVHQFTLTSLLINISDDIEGKVEDALQVAWREVKQETDTAGRSLEVPDVAHGRRQFDVSHALTAYL